jgi:hypothetical protein
MPHLTAPCHINALLVLVPPSAHRREGRTRGARVGNSQNHAHRHGCVVYAYYRYAFTSNRRAVAGTQKDACAVWCV